MSVTKFELHRFWPGHSLRYNQTVNCLSQVIEEDGFAIVPDVAAQATCARLIEAVERMQKTGLRRRGGVRNLLQTLPEVAELTQSPAVSELVAPILGKDFFSVRGILFDKTP